MIFDNNEKFIKKLEEIIVDKTDVDTEQNIINGYTIQLENDTFIKCCMDEEDRHFLVEYYAEKEDLKERYYENKDEIEETEAEFFNSSLLNQFDTVFNISSSYFYHGTLQELKYYSIGEMLEAMLCIK